MELGNTQPLTEMLLHFKKQHDRINQALADSGDSKYCSPFESISVYDIKMYLLEKENGVNKELLDV